MLNEATKISYKIAYSCCWAVASTGNKKRPKLIFFDIDSCRANYFKLLNV